MAYREKDTKKWTAQWFETNVMGEKKKRRKRGFETKREALEFERSKKLSSERSMDMKLSDFIEIYFSDKQNDLKDRTIKNKRYMMQQHIVPYFGNQMMSEIKASQIIQWQNEIQKNLLRLFIWAFSFAFSTFISFFSQSGNSISIFIIQKICNLSLLIWIKMSISVQCDTNIFMT